jgi:hypothetical protein
MVPCLVWWGRCEADPNCFSLTPTVARCPDLANGRSGKCRRFLYFASVSNLYLAFWDLFAWEGLWPGRIWRETSCVLRQGYLVAFLVWSLERYKDAYCLRSLCRSFVCLLLILVALDLNAAQRLKKSIALHMIQSTGEPSTLWSAAKEVYVVDEFAGNIY